MKTEELKKIANQVRKSIIESVYTAQSGHSGSSLSSVEVLTALYFDQMNIDPDDLENPDRDRFILSKGHAVPALYGIFVEKGILERDELKTLRKIGSRLPGHPNLKTPGIDMSTGSLGQGISVAVGMALAGKIDKKEYNVFCLLGDGELEEGQVWEAAMFAGSHHLNNLILFIDNNNLQISGTLGSVNSPEPIADKFEAFNFRTITVEDGNDISQVIAAIEEAKKEKTKPVAVILKTVKGKGISFMENVPIWHRKKMTEQEYLAALEELNQNTL